MDFVLAFLDACSTVSKDNRPADDDASEVQLNAFEFRNYKTRLDGNCQRVVERIVNQWCAMLVKGRTMKVNGFEEKVNLDRDMLNLEYAGEILPLRAIRKIEFFKDGDEMAMDAPYGLDVAFEGIVGDTNLTFSFEQERHRLSFAITIRILRTRDPLLDPTQTMEVVGKDPDEDDERKTFTRLATMPRYSPERGIPVVISVSDLKIYHKIISTSRHVYLELFVRYPSQEQFLYAKSPTTHIPPQVLLNEDTSALKRKARGEENEDGEDAKKEEAKKILGADIPICAMRFNLKNVKLKIPKTPHTIFGRMMARDDYFPTTVGTFEIEVLKSHLQDRRNIDPAEKRREKNGKDDGSRTEPETLALPMYSSSASIGGDAKDKKLQKVGLLTLRLLGYITDDQAYNANSSRKSEQSDERSGKGSEEGSEGGGEGEEEEEEEREAEEEEEEDD
eukprot:TRINITY_DN54942_c0_g1_i1.p1 TRINITY_DN54942_c0_g1~~TRINITY_DN54942_c0_g1_i1.p1  ORF type:complete len:448 (+),score=136.03 TRINITY_DN54942_c0_g1_i1:101-1444(+)